MKEYSPYWDYILRQTPGKWEFNVQLQEDKLHIPEDNKFTNNPGAHRKKQLLRFVMGKLSRAEKRAIFAIFRYGNQRKAAEHLGIRESSICMALSRAREKALKAQVKFRTIIESHDQPHT